ncbi:MAG TPA: DNA-binding protein [bacterium]|nr:DNA-binding protein [bacterium]HPN41880.1 DNA-binding protein [bacterium]
MATITVKNIPADLYEKLKVTASASHRSINNHVIWCIENTIKSRKVKPEEFIAQLDNFYENVKAPVLTDEILQDYKKAGRL